MQLLDRSQLAPPAAPQAASLQRYTMYLSVCGPGRGGSGAPAYQLCEKEVQVAFYGRRQTLLAELTALMRSSEEPLLDAYLQWRAVQLPVGTASDCLPEVLRMHLARANPQAVAAAAVQAAGGLLQQQQQRIQQLAAQLMEQAAQGPSGSGQQAGSAALPLQGAPTAGPAPLQLFKNTAHQGWPAAAGTLLQRLEPKLGGQPSMAAAAKLPGLADWLLRRCGADRSEVHHSPDGAACRFTNGLYHATSLLTSAALMRGGALASSRSLPPFSNFLPQVQGAFHGETDPLFGIGNRKGDNGLINWRESECSIGGGHSCMFACFIRLVGRRQRGQLKSQRRCASGSASSHGDARAPLWQAPRIPSTGQAPRGGRWVRLSGRPRAGLGTTGAYTALPQELACVPPSLAGDPNLEVCGRLPAPHRPDRQRPVCRAAAGLHHPGGGLAAGAGAERLPASPAAQRGRLRRRPPPLLAALAPSPAALLP